MQAIAGGRYLIEAPADWNGGLVALFFLGMAVTLWLSADLRDEWRELRALRLLLAESTLETDR